MSEDKEPTQKTPKGKEIPVPKRDEFIENLRRVSKPADDESKDSESSDTEKE